MALLAVVPNLLLVYFFFISSYSLLYFHVQIKIKKVYLQNNIPLLGTIISSRIVLHRKGSKRNQTSVFFIVTSLGRRAQEVTAKYYVCCPIWSSTFGLFFHLFCSCFTFYKYLRV